MPNLQSQATTLRSSGHQFKLYLSYLPRTLVFAASVNGTPAYSTTGSIRTVTVDNVTTGAITDVREGMLVEFFTSGVSKGIGRVATGGGASTTLQIMELSAGTLNITDNDTLQVRADLRIWDRLVSNTAALNKDSRTAYSDQGANPNPICNSGGPIVGFVDPTSGNLTVNFYGSTSKVIDPDSGGTFTHAWTFPGATPSSDTAADPTSIAFPAGPAVIATHTATDSGNSKASTQYIPVWAHNTTTYKPISLSECNLRYADAEGWTAEVTVADTSLATAALMPTGCMVVIWAVETYAGTQASYGSNVTGRSHIKFVGYLDRAQIRVDPDTDAVRFTAISPLAVLAKTPALSQITIQKSSPTKWQHLKSNSVYRTLWYLWHWHNTAFNLHDFMLPASGDLGYTRLAAGVTSNQLEQFRDIAGSMGLEVTCDRLGRFIIQKNPQLVALGSRSSLTTTYTFSTADLLFAEWEEPYHWPSKTVVGEGITDGTSKSNNKPVFARAPGTAPAARGLNVETLGKQIVDNQADLNQRTGLRFAMVNSLYDGKVVPKGLGFATPSGYDVFDPAYREWVTFPLLTGLSQRAPSFSASSRWLFATADIRYLPNEGTIDNSYTIDHETYGADANKETRKTPESSGVPSLPPIDFYFPGWDLPPLDDIPLTGGTSVMLRILTDGVALTTNSDTSEASGGPTWTFSSLATLGIAGTITDAAVNPRSTYYLGTGNIIQIAIATYDEIGLLEWDRSTNGLSYNDVYDFATSLTGAPSSTLRIRNIDYTRGVADLLVCISDYTNRSGHTGVWSIVSDDNGATWGTETQITAFNHTTSLNSPSVYVGRTGIIYAAAMLTTGVAGTFGIHRSVDGGVSFSRYASLAVTGSALPGTLHFPWHDNAAETICYYASMDEHGGGFNRIYRAVGTTRTLITPNDGARDYGMKRSRALHTPDNNRQRVGVAGSHSLDASNPPTHSAVFLSADAGDTWVKIGDTQTGNDVYSGIHVSENGVVYVWGINNMWVGIWNDLIAGGALDSRQGNLSASSTARTVNIIGG